MWLLWACSGGSSVDSGKPADVLLPDVSTATFVAGIDHPYLPWPVGAAWSYQAETPDGTETVEVSVPGDTKPIMGVTATVVRDTASIGGVVTEDTDDWYAQDSDGNVWYLGEDTCEYEDGQCASAEGSWEWGKDGALPGWAMPADPQVDGVTYFQEYSKGHAEDTGRILSIATVGSVPAGDFSDCIETQDGSLLEPDVVETKTYCRGVGLVYTVEPDATESLIAYALP